MESQKLRRQRKWDNENLDLVRFQIYKGWKDDLRLYAKERGVSLNRLIINALEAYTGLPVSTNKRKMQQEKGDES
jgi:hypothetical protein